mmetsp:Transcript_10771/g.43587  ORF Transcript_10771/g.43587 Transcript_10771/m.43587 type:complete len:391 (-) Transcript_10771:664-1836(-)
MGLAPTSTPVARATGGVPRKTTSSPARLLFRDSVRGEAETARHRVESTNRGGVSSASSASSVCSGLLLPLRVVGRPHASSLLDHRPLLGPRAAVRAGAAVGGRAVVVVVVEREAARARPDLRAARGGVLVVVVVDALAALEEDLVVRLVGAAARVGRLERLGAERADGSVPRVGRRVVGEREARPLLGDALRDDVPARVERDLGLLVADRRLPLELELDERALGAAQRARLALEFGREGVDVAAGGEDVRRAVLGEGLALLVVVLEADGVELHRALRAARVEARDDLVGRRDGALRAAARARFVAPHRRGRLEEQLDAREVDDRAVGQRRVLVGVPLAGDLGALPRLVDAAVHRDLAPLADLGLPDAHAKRRQRVPVRGRVVVRSRRERG